MTYSKTTDKCPTLQVVLPQSDYDEVISLKKKEKRSQSQMSAILIAEALATRKAPSNQ